MIDTLLRKFHDEDGILCSQPNDHDDTDLHIDTILVAVTGRAQKSGQLVHDILRENCAEDARRHREEDCERHRPALIECRKAEESKDQRQP